MGTGSSSAAPVAYQIRSESSVSQCPGSGSLAPCVIGPVSGIVTLDVLESGEALLDTSSAPLAGESGQLDLAIAIWSGLDQLVGIPLPVAAPFDVWQFQGSIAGAPVDVGLQRLGQIEISGGTAVGGDYTGPEVLIDVTAVPVPEPGPIWLLALGTLGLFLTARPATPQARHLVGARRGRSLKPVALDQELMFETRLAMYVQFFVLRARDHT